MDYRHPILAKPSGITLEQHSFDVVSEGNLLAKAMPIVFKKYNELVDKSLVDRLCVISEIHDYGKMSDKWQTACRKDYEAYLNLRVSNNGDFKAFVKSLQSETLNLLTTGCRHEFVSLDYADTKRMPLLLQASIAAHHSKLSLNYVHRWKDEGYTKFWKKFYKESNKVYEEETIEDLAIKQYECAGLRGLLQLADHRASAKEDNQYIPTLTDFSYNFPFSQKRGVQKLVEENWDKDILLLRAPTGAGKTDASLLWAKLQIDNHRAQRLIIAMPTRFTSNALAISISEQLSDTGLYHSSAWVNRFENSNIPLDEARTIHSYARLLLTPITVCTIDHLLMSLTLTREDHHLTTFNLANSCVVIDEADFYDEFTNANILVLLKLLKIWRVPVLIMSASLPQSAVSDYRKCGYDVSDIIEDKSDSYRVRFEIKDIAHTENITDSKHIIQKMINGGNGIIYANTIDRAKQYYNYVKQLMEESNKDIPIKLYHSCFTESDKQNREEEILGLLGRNAWESKKAKGIVIMTQIGEMSVNVSADVMLSDLCPIDRLVQRAGRLCRFNKNIGELYVVVPEKEGMLYPAPYGMFDVKSKMWLPNTYLLKTLELLSKKQYTSESLVNLINDVYSDEKTYSAIADHNAKELLLMFRCNWLINPAQGSKEDDDKVMNWRSRCIEEKGTVYISQPELNNFYSYFRFQSWSSATSLEVPIYQLKKMKSKGMVYELGITISNQESVIHVLKDGFYDQEIGIKFPSDEGSA